MCSWARRAGPRHLRGEPLPRWRARAYFNRLQLTGAKARSPTSGARNRLAPAVPERRRPDYLSLDRSAETLSGGEAQRIRLASQIGSGLTGVMYVLDEPSIGLHQRDNDRLLGTLKHLRDMGNSVIVVEHDEDMIRAADHVIDMGPGAGVHGGRVMAQGTPAEVAATPLADRPVPVRRALPCASHRGPPSRARSRRPERRPNTAAVQALRGATRQQPEGT
jgi:excinuclease ABC subunit A